jgi:hypothetical protein
LGDDKAIVVFCFIFLFPDDWSLLLHFAPFIAIDVRMQGKAKAQTHVLS